MKKKFYGGLEKAILCIHVALVGLINAKIEYRGSRKCYLLYRGWSKNAVLL